MSKKVRKQGGEGSNRRSQVDFDNPDDSSGDKPDDKILREAKKRFKRAQEWENDFRRLYIDDVKFANGDSDNGWQWPNDLKRDRDVNQRPTLTVNKTATLVLQITNDARQNKPSIKVAPTGDEASFESAQIYEGLVRAIERDSKAQRIYDDATESCVEGGIGYWRLITEYSDDESFDQIIKIAPVRDQLSVYLDPDIKQRDGSDAKFGFIFEEVAKGEHPELDDISPSTGLSETDDWVSTDYIRIAEYYRILEEKDTLIFMEDENGIQATFKLSELTTELKKKIDEGEKVKRRSITVKKLQWFKIAGNKIIDRRETMPGRYIPIARIPGREKIIEGRLERSGHVRKLKDPQRMYNYNTSAGVEFGALQTKTPWIGPKEAFDNNEVAWANANKSNAAYLTFNAVDSEGNPIAPPSRPPAPEFSNLYQVGMQIAASEMEMASGQYPAQMGQPSNERSGKAIAERQRQGDTATYHFIDSLAGAIRHTGVMIIDLIPEIYDTERVMQILGKDGSQTKVFIRPDQKQAFSKEKDREEIRVALNPRVGRYLVESDIGPAYSTQRQEAWNAFVQITTQAPDLINEIGDLMFNAADFPLADKIAERIRRKIEATSPFLLDPEAQNPVVAQLQGEVQDKAQQIGELLQKLAEQTLKIQGYAQKSAVSVYEAETKRIDTLGKQMPASPEELKALMQQVFGEMMNTSLQPVLAAGEDDLMADAAGLKPPQMAEGSQPTSIQKLETVGTQGLNEQTNQLPQ